VPTLLLLFSHDLTTICEYQIRRIEAGTELGLHRPRKDFTAEALVVRKNPFMLREPQHERGGGIIGN
jgi:hypothetical protein